MSGSPLLFGETLHRLGGAHLAYFGKTAPVVDLAVALSRPESAFGLLLAPVRGTLEQLFLRSHGFVKRTYTAALLEDDRHPGGLTSFLPVADRDAIAQWELDQLSRFLSDVEQRRGERLHAQDVCGGFVAELSTATLSTAPHASLEDALRDLAYQAFDRDRPGG